MAFNARQLKFIEAYTGNGADAARLAGYKGDDKTLASVAYKLLTNTDIKRAIQERVAKQTDSLIATKEERQRFWTEFMRSPALEPKDRMKASELLGRSQADFMEKVEVSGKLEVEKLSDEELDARIGSLAPKLIK